MLTYTGLKFPIEPIINQVKSLSFDKRLPLNYTDGKLFSGKYETLPEFKGTPLGDVLDALPNTGEARLLKLTSAESYTAHYDPDDRYQMSIITNQDSFLLDLENERFHHMPADGTVWLMDTSKRHVACNFGGTPRIHLNVRLLLPEFKSPGVLLDFEGGDYDWKQELHGSFMSYVNSAIKEGLITGIEKVSDTALKINYTDRLVVETISISAMTKGFKVKVHNV